MTINIEKNKKIYTKNFINTIKDILIIDKKEKIFAALVFCDKKYVMDIYFFKIRELDSNKNYNK